MDDQTLEEYLAECKERFRVQGLKRQESLKALNMESRQLNSEPLPWELPLGASSEKH